MVCVSAICKTTLLTISKWCCPVAQAETDLPCRHPHHRPYGSRGTAAMVQAVEEELLEGTSL